MSRLLNTVFLSALLSAGAVLWGCHADPDDPAGQAGELKDPVRRENALANLHHLYTHALDSHDGNRQDPAVKAVTDVSIDLLVSTYLDHPEDTQNGLTIINLLSEMRDTRGLPALIKALNWRAEVNEEHAIRAATTIRSMEIPDAKKGDVLDAVTEALEKVTGARAIDNRMRIEFLRTLGALDDRRATPILTKIATTQSEEQNFLINRLAAEQVGRIGDPAAVPALIKALFLFAPSNPAMRMNDVAAESLVRIGRPSLQPMLAVLDGHCEECNAIATQYIEAVRQRDERAARGMSVDGLTNAEATFVLGTLGFREALDPIIAATQSDDQVRRMQSAIALASLNLEPADRERVRSVMKQVYESLDVPMKPQLIAAMSHLYDAHMQTFFFEQASDRELFSPARVEAVRAFSLLANKEEAQRMQAFIAREPSSAAEHDAGDREAFQEMSPALAAAVECDEDLSCWTGKLGEDDPIVARKAAFAIARFGSGNAQAISALVSKLDHPEIVVRLAVLAALDRIAVHGSAEAVAKIDELHEAEEGRSIWTNFRKRALPIQARLRNRAAQ